MGGREAGEREEREGGEDGRLSMALERGEIGRDF